MDESSKPTKTVLVCDDEDALVRIIRASLLTEGYNVETARDGVECMRKVRSEHPGLLILDVMMPRKDGLEVLRELKSNAETANIPVIMLTALEGVDDNETAVRLGCNCFLPKPYVPIELVAIVKRLFAETDE